MVDAAKANTVIWLIIPALSIILWWLKIDTTFVWLLVAFSFIVVGLILRQVIK